MQYELFYIIGQNNEEKMDSIKKEVEQTLIDEGATFSDIEVITKRKFSYEIKHQIRGTYIAKRFEMPDVDYWASENDSAEKNDPLMSATKKLNLNQDILRFLIVKADELPELRQKETPVRKEDVSTDKRRRPEETKKFSKPAPASTEKENGIDQKLEEILNI